jgi:hypothetical protein
MVLRDVIEVVGYQHALERQFLLAPVKERDQINPGKAG